MVARAKADDNVISLSNVPATSLQRGVVFAVAAVLLAAFAITVPFAGVQLPPFVSFNPSVESIVFVNDLVTSILLYSQYAITRSRAILALAVGYLYTALIVIPHMLTFPGAFTGLLWRRSSDQRVVVLLLECRNAHGRDRLCAAG